MKKLVLVLLALMVSTSLVLSGCGGNASDTSDKASESKNSWQKIEEKGEFVLGLDESFPPMGFRDEKGEIVGFDIDVAKEVTTRLGLELKLQPISWDAKEQELNTGKIDAIWNGLTITDDRKKNILFSDAYMKNRQVLVVKADSNYAKLSDLEGKTLGLQAASSAADALTGSGEFKDKLAEVIEFDDNNTALMDLKSGGLDVVLMDEIVARYYIAMKKESYKVLDEALAGEEYGIGFRLEDKELMEKFQETLNAMAKDGKLAEISNKWFAEDITTVAK